MRQLVEREDVTYLKTVKETFCKRWFNKECRSIKEKRRRQFKLVNNQVCDELGRQLAEACKRAKADYFLKLTNRVGKTRVPVRIISELLGSKARNSLSTDSVPDLAGKPDAEKADILNRFYNRFSESQEPLDLSLVNLESSPEDDP